MRTLGGGGLEKEKSYRYIIEGYHPRRSHRKFHGLGYLADNHSSLAKIPNKVLDDLYRLQGQPQKNVIHILIPCPEDQWVGNQWEDKYFAYRSRCYECGESLREIALDYYRCNSCHRNTYRDDLPKRRGWDFTRGNNHCEHLLDSYSNWCAVCDGSPSLPEEDSVHEGHEVACRVLGKRTICRHGRLKRSYRSKDLKIRISACSICASGGSRTFGESEKEDRKKSVDAVSQYEEGLLPDLEAINDSASESETATRLIAGPDPDELDEKPKVDAESKADVDDPEEDEEEVEEETTTKPKKTFSGKIPEPWEMTDTQCRAKCVDGSRCQQSVYGGGSFCFYHTKLMTFVDDKRIPWVKNILDNRDSDWVKDDKVFIKGENTLRMTLPVHDTEEYIPAEISESEHQLPGWIIEKLKNNGYWPTSAVVQDLAGEFPLYEGGKYQPIISLGFEEACRRVAHERKIEWDDSVDKEFRAFLEFVWKDPLLEYALGYIFLYRPPVFAVDWSEDDEEHEGVWGAVGDLLGPVRKRLGFFARVLERFLEATHFAHKKRKAGDTGDFEIVLEKSLPTIIKRGNTTYEIWKKEPFEYNCVYQRTLHEDKDYEENAEHLFGMSAAEAKEWLDRVKHRYMVSALATTGHEGEIATRHKRHSVPHHTPLPETDEEIIQACNDAPRKQELSLIWKEMYTPMRGRAINDYREDVGKGKEALRNKKNYFLVDQIERLQGQPIADATINWLFSEAAKKIARTGMRSFRAVPPMLMKELKGLLKKELRDIRGALFPPSLTKPPRQTMYDNLKRMLRDVTDREEWDNMNKGERQGLVEKWQHSLVSLSAPVDRDATEPRPFEEVLAAEPEYAPSPREDKTDYWSARDIEGIISDEEFKPVISNILLEKFADPPEIIVVTNYDLLPVYGGGKKILSILKERGFEKNRFWLRRIKKKVYEALGESREEIINAGMKSLGDEEEDRNNNTTQEELEKIRREKEENRLKRQFDYQWYGGWDHDQEICVPGIYYSLYRKPQKKWDEERPKPEPLRTLPLIDDLTSKYLAKPWTEWVEEWKRSQILPILTPAFLGPPSSVDLTFQQYPYLLVLIGYEYITDAKIFSYAVNEWCEKHSTPQKHCLRCETATPETWEVFRPFFTNHHIEILPRAMRCLDRIRSELEWGERGFCSNPYLNRVKKSGGNLKILKTKVHLSKIQLLS
jgi:hypothetical protein